MNEALIPQPFAFHFTRRRQRRNMVGFTLMEVLVVVAVILTLVSVTFPVIDVINQRKNKALAMTAMKHLGEASGLYAGQHDGVLPDEDSKGSDSWRNAAAPENSEVWYNALPRIISSGRGVGDFANDPRGFYTMSNPLYLPGAKYPKDDRKLVEPLFAIAMNGKLHRKNEDNHKPPLRLADIVNSVHTVLFLEQGLSSERKEYKLKIQDSFDGGPKGGAKSFVGRYGGQGHLVFVDGHVELADPAELLMETGEIPFPPRGIIWCRSVEEDPNAPNPNKKK